MCGICFTLKQRIHRHPRAAKEASQEIVPHALWRLYDALAQSDVVLEMPNAPAPPARVAESHQLCPCLCAPARTPAGADATTQTSGAAPASVSPATANSLRIIRIFHNRYNRHPLDVATDTCSFANICAHSPSYAAMLHNICRRGPDTFGATRRNFTEALLEIPSLRHRSALLEGTAPGQAERQAPATSRPENSSAAVVPQRGQMPVSASASAAAGNTMCLHETEDSEWWSFSTDTQAISAVLGLRGHETVRQPYEIEVETDVEDKSEPNKSYLLWNGEIFNGPMCPPPWGSDTVALASRLSQLERSCVPEAWRSTCSEAERRMLLPACQQRFLAKCVHFFEADIQGPYGFLFYASQLQMVVFGRDPLGRHSLLTHLSVYPVMAPLSAQQQQQQQQQRARAEGESDGNGRGPAVGQGPARTECTQLEVEFLVSSVGSQHAPLSRSLATAEEAAVEEEGLAAAQTTEATTGQKPQPGRGHGTTDSYAARAAGKRRREKDEDGDEDDDGEKAASAGAANTSAACWQELPITGFFGLPLNIPMLQLPGSNSSNSSAACQATASDTRRASDVFFNSLPDALRGVLLHCPFGGGLHTTHPLLRAAIRAEAPTGPGSSHLPHTVTATTPQSGPGGGVVPAKRPPPLRTPSMPEPPASTVPALVVDAVQRSSPRDDTVEEAWVHWAACRYVEALSAAVYRRCNTASAGAEDARGVEKLYRARRRPLCIPFSGGIDCTMLAALAHYAMPIETPIELVSVAFGEHPEQAPDRIAALHAMRELLALPQPAPELSVYAPTGPPEPIASEREWRLVFVDVPHRTTAATPHILDLMNPRHTVMDLDIATALWYAARARGRMQRLFARDVARAATSSTAATNDAAACLSLDNFSKHLRIGTPTVTVAPAQAPAEPPTGSTTQDETDDVRRFTPLIDVLIAEGRNAPNGGRSPVLLSTLGKEYSAFLQPVLQQFGYKKLGNYLNDAVKAGVVVFAADAPSKAVRLKRQEDLRRAVPPPPCPWFLTDAMREVVQRQAIDTTSRDAAANEESPVVDSEPAGTNASPAATPITTNPLEGTYESDYCSRAKVLLLGMGADETLGGYTRYRRFFQRQGMDGARRELELDFARLWQRNLGRDDRVTMDSGREPRFPYLDEELLATLEDIVATRRESLLAAMPAPLCDSSVTAEDAATAAAASAKAQADDCLQQSIDPVLSFRLPPGEGDKRVLRRAAAIIGLCSVTRLQKRAIQFGSRIAERKIRGSADL